ncbi:metallophosphoesterase family protein [Actinomycetospora lemnae]|uniref:Metallophosphoesterase n=1 Tax=Actinomycetospora lemnae TaxID=3019891 RepID=A0ABT5SYB5_9PSEU|nr:metallophosphoesterase [Actinomycetospora sp. DW7H6]MDD7967859.1 metallophosphoesterase [Actinomycetospora sp. DW7H6]
MGGRTDEPVRHAAVRWLSPTELVRTGLTVALGSVAAAYADKRDVMAGTTFAQDVVRYEVPAGEPFWVDYLSDTGDGFPAMATIATLLGDTGVAVDGERLPRGHVLLLGGDEVYPVAGTRAYEERLEAPLDAQFVVDPERDRPTVHAIPGNHDWYDGLTAFLRVFAQGRDLAGWHTAQRRSYFALALPHDWWVLAMDIQLDTYIDATQLEWFRGVVARIPSGARIVLLTATPAWYGAVDGDDEAMDRLAFFLRDVLGERRDLRVRLVLTGDTHHYARYTLARPEGSVGPDQVLVTAGHGGAYTSPTHFLPDALHVTTDLADPGPERSDREHTYVRADATFPTARTSRAEAARVLWRLPARNGSLFAVLGALQSLVVVPAVLGLWVLAVLGAIVVGAVSAAFVAPNRKRWWGAVPLRLSLAVAQVGLAGGVAALGTWAHEVLAPWRAGLWSVIVGGLEILALVGVAGLAASLVLALFLLVVGRWANRNELFAAQSIEDHKGFLRMRIAPDGTLTIFVLGVDRVPRDWTWSPGHAPRWTPTPAVSPHLVEVVELRP